MTSGGRIMTQRPLEGKPFAPGLPASLCKLLRTWRISVSCSMPHAKHPRLRVLPHRQALNWYIPPAVIDAVKAHRNQLLRWFRRPCPVCGGRATYRLAEGGEEVQCWGCRRRELEARWAGQRSGLVG
jgi:hypothetical protein